jgi:hypothetical protein
LSGQLRFGGDCCFRRGDGRFRSSAALLCLHRLVRGFRRAPFFGDSRLSGRSNGPLGGAHLSGSFCFGGGDCGLRCGDGSVRGNTALLCLRGFLDRPRGPLFRRSGHPCLGNSSFSVSAALLRLRGFSGGFRCAPFFGHSRLGSDLNGTLGSALLSNGPCFRRSDQGFRGGDRRFRGRAPLLGFRGFRSRLHGSLFFGHSSLGGGSRGLLDLLEGSVGVYHFGFSVGPGRIGRRNGGFRLGAALLGLCCVSGSFRRAFFHSDARVVGYSCGLLSVMLPRGGPCLRLGNGRFRGGDTLRRFRFGLDPGRISRGAALIRLRGVGSSLRCALFFGHPRIGGHLGGLLELLGGALCIRRFGLGGSASRFRRGDRSFRRSAGHFRGGATLLGLRRFSGGFRGALFFSASRVGGGSHIFLELFDGAADIPHFGFGGGPSRVGRSDSSLRRSAGRFRGGATLLRFFRFSRGLRGAPFFSDSRVGGNSSGLLQLLGGPECSHRLGFGSGPRRFSGSNGCVRRGEARFRGGATLLGCCRFSEGFRSALFFGYSRRVRNAYGLFDGSIRIRRFGFGGGPSRFGRGEGGFRRGTTLLRLCGFCQCVRCTLFLRRARFDGGSRCLTGSLRLRNRLRSSLFLGDTPLRRSPRSFAILRLPLICGRCVKRPALAGSGYVW